MEEMRRGLPALIVLLLAVPATALLGGCGSNTKTVSVAGAPPDTTETGAGSQTQSTKSSTTTTSTSSVPTQTTTAGGTPTPTTRTAPEPAFTEKTASSSSSVEGLGAATAVVAAHGYSATNTSTYHPNQTLRVLIGTRPGSGQQAFFFVDGRYIGTDTKEPSASVSVAGQSETEVTLAYPGQAKVTFQLNNGKLVPLSTVPSESARQ
jgi:LppP/LprE lipoprotein